MATLDENLTIRPAGLQDAAVVLALYGDLAAAYGEQQADAGILRQWDEVLADHRQHILVAEQDGAVAGTLTLVVVPNLGHNGQPWAAIANVVVAAGHRGHGIGKALIAEAGQIARRHNCYKIVLSSNLIRKEAHEFYRRLGWKQTHIGFSLEL